MKIAMLGASHWHTPMYLDALNQCPGCWLAGLSDPQPELIVARGQKYGCPIYADDVELLDRERPDFLFLFGEHVRMPELIRLAIRRGLPFAVEKPAGIDGATVRQLAKEADENRVFHAVDFVYRTAPLTGLLQRWRAQGLFRYFTSLRMRYLTGAPARYRQWHCAWMLDPHRSGGGVGINLSVHYLDLLRFLTGEEIAQITGACSRRVYAEAVEDHHWVLAQTQSGITGVVETGYTGTDRPEDLDYFEIMTDTREMIYRGECGELYWKDRSGKEGTEQFATTAPRTVYVRAVLQALQTGAPALAGLHDAAAALEALEHSGYFAHASRIDEADTPRKGA